MSIIKLVFIYNSYLCPGCLRGGSTEWNFGTKKFFMSAFSSRVIFRHVRLECNCRLGGGGEQDQGSRVAVLF